MKKFFTPFFSLFLAFAATSAVALEPAGTFIKFEKLEQYSFGEAMLVFRAAQFYDMNEHVIRVHDSDGIASLAFLYMSAAAPAVDAQTVRATTWDQIKNNPVENWGSLRGGFDTAFQMAIGFYSKLKLAPPKGWTEDALALRLHGLESARAHTNRSPVPSYAHLFEGLGGWLEKNAGIHNYAEIFSNQRVEKGRFLFDRDRRHSDDPVAELALGRGFLIDRPIVSRSRPIIDVDTTHLVVKLDEFPADLCPAFLATRTKK